MKKILIIKYDGIGDYLFIRLFWKQLSQFAKEKDLSLSFLGANRFRSLMYKYDKAFFDDIFCIGMNNVLNGFLKEKLLFFIPKYRKRLRESHLLKKMKRKKFDIGINAQFSRYKEIKKIFLSLKVEKNTLYLTKMI